MKQIILAYVPVLHRGYLNFFAKYPKVKTLYMIDEQWLYNFRQLEKDIRALPTKTMKKVLESLELFESIEILSTENVEKLIDIKDEFIVPDEDEMHQVMSGFYFPIQDMKITWDSIFLRWDRKRSESHVDVHPDVKISTDKFDREVMEGLNKDKQHSSDWWRQVTCALSRDRHII